MIRHTAGCLPGLTILVLAACGGDVASMSATERARLRAGCYEIDWAANAGAPPRTALSLDTERMFALPGDTSFFFGIERLEAGIPVFGVTHGTWRVTTGDSLVVDVVVPYDGTHRLTLGPARRDSLSGDRRYVGVAADTTQVPAQGRRVKC